MQKVLPSEQIAAFLDFLQECQSIYKTNIKEVWKYDKRQQDQLHDLEFAMDYKERCRIGTRVHNERLARRACKDQAEMTEEIAKFCSDKQNKQFLDKLKGLVERQRRAEEYLTGERHYNRRGGDAEC